MSYNSSTSRTDANALIPIEDASEIIKGMTEKSKALALMKNVKMSSKQKRMPVLSALPTAYFVNGDTGLKRTTKLSWENKFLEAEEIAVIVPVPEAVLDDSEYDIWGEARPLVEEAFASVLDNAIFFGINRPTSWALSVIEHAASAGHSIVRGAIVGQDLAGDVNDTMALVEADGFDVNGFVADTTLKSDLRGLRDDNGQFIYQPSMVAGTPSALFGEQIEYVKGDAFDNSEADLLAGDWTSGIVGIRQDLTYKLLDQAVITDDSGNIIYNLAQQDMVAMRVVARFAWQIANPIRRRNTNAATRSPFSVLRPVGWTP
jgi:HK97 family phage major capsid protein